MALFFIDLENNPSHDLERNCHGPFDMAKRHTTVIKIVEDFIIKSTENLKKHKYEYCPDPGSGIVRSLVKASL